MSDSDTNIQLRKKVIQTKELIEMVRERRCLWDRSCPEYRDRGVKESAWTEIYKEIEPNFDLMKEEQRNQIGGYITRKWYNLRDSYVKSRKTLRPRNRPYLYAEVMKFLDSTGLNETRSSKKAQKIYDDLEEEENDAEEPVNWITDVFNDTDNLDTSEQPLKRLKLEYNPEPKGTTEINDTVVQVLASILQKEEDEDRAFFKSITPAVKKLSDHSKFEFRIQVMKLLNGLKMRERGKTVTLKRERMSNEESDSE